MIVTCPNCGAEIRFQPTPAPTPVEPTKESASLSSEPKPNAKIFISYSQESEEHNANVLEFAHKLVHAGLTPLLDQLEEHPADLKYPLVSRS